MSRLWTILIGIRSSLWFVPMGIVALSIGLAFGLLELDAHLGLDLKTRWPRFFGAGAEGSRTLLAAIATSMITVAGISFSTTMVALSLAANQYSSRVLGNFMRDRSNQVALGTFVSIFIYCLLVLRTIRRESDAAPSLSVVGALVLALVGIIVLIYFIHHVASSMQVWNILAAVSGETLNALETLYPDRIGDELAELEGSDEERAMVKASSWNVIPARCTGYIQTIRPQPLLKFASQHDLVIRLDRTVGDFVGAGSRLGYVNGPADAVERITAEVNSCLGVNSSRTIEQDPGFGIRQIVDIALKALSPGINDPTTAVNCLDQFEPILRYIVQRHIPSPFRYYEGQLRLIAARPSFQSLLDQILREVVVHARSHYSVVRRILEILISVADEATLEGRRELLLSYGRLAVDQAEPHLSAPDRTEVSRKYQELRMALSGRGRLRQVEE